ncbi:hypothetical protein BCON_0047g00300 [Botryotinia convoluta]|uniref:Uncharacterized protein n=1 Tax=Botryotinia convoluta TaxID=54673 RepID=A0A4Z1II22_9HELO|nr:hypothetical protein BCON_0047g00300 [Botryotinia convoluta]
MSLYVGKRFKASAVGWIPTIVLYASLEPLTMIKKIQRNPGNIRPSYTSQTSSHLNKNREKK